MPNRYAKFQKIKDAEYGFNELPAEHGIHWTSHIANTSHINNTNTVKKTVVNTQRNRGKNDIYSRREDLNESFDDGMKVCYQFNLSWKII